jgi:leucyl aminopeptidase
MHIELMHRENAGDQTTLCPVWTEEQLHKLLSQYPGLDDRMKELIKEDFQLDSEDQLTLYPDGKRLILQSIKSPFHYRNFRHAFKSFGLKYKSRTQDNLAIDFRFFTTEDATLAGAVINGLSLGLYQIGLYKTSETDPVPDKFRIDITNAPESFVAAARHGMELADTQKRILDLVNAAPNHKNPEIIATWALDSGNKYGYKVRVFEYEELEEMGMSALLAVNRGSEYPAKFLVLDYQGNTDDDTVIGLVGKGVIFDTGGLSIKPSRNMHYMKSDMGGAAAVLGALEMAAKGNINQRVLGFIPLTDNSVDARAVKPGDVIQSYSGKSIEVIDTDAEGRLILADALAYAVKHYKIDYLIDLATLTGSAVRTFGNHCAAMFSKNDSLCKYLEQAGESCGERVWRLPLWDDYADEMKSDVADIRNLSITPAAGAITAAKFLEAFVSDHPAWAHLDIAGTAFHGNSLSRQYSATAYGIALLYRSISLLHKEMVHYEG